MHQRHLFHLFLWLSISVVYGDGIRNRGSIDGYHVKVGIAKANYLKESETVSSRIISGTAVNGPNVYPFHAGIVITLTSGWTSVCGGSLVSSTRVLTAAHCWFDGQIQAKLFTVVLGSTLLFSGGTRIDTKDVVVHPLWNNENIIHDIAIAKIKSVQFSNSIQVIPLPKLSDVSLNLAGMTATVSGFGKTSDAQNSIPTTTALHHVTLQIISNSECQKSFGIPIHGSHLCTSGAGKKGTCDGDSGGPLTIVRNNQRILVGIVSFGLANGCERGLPSVYTRVTAFLTWLQANL